MDGPGESHSKQIAMHFTQIMSGNKTVHRRKGAQATPQWTEEISNSKDPERGLLGI